MDDVNATRDTEFQDVVNKLLLHCCILHNLNLECVLRHNELMT